MKYLGIFDLFSALLLLVVGTNAPTPIGLIIFCSVILIVKSFLGLGFAGFIDFISAFFLVVGIEFNPPFLIYLILMILIGQKGLISVIS